MQNVNVQINYADGVIGTYLCTERPYFNYENNTAALKLTTGDTMVVNMNKITSIIYPTNARGGYHPASGGAGGSTAIN